MLSNIRRLFVFLAAITLSLSCSSAFADTVKNIVVEDNQRVETATVISYMDLKVGDSFDQKKINSSLKNMFDTGLFSDVSISREGNNLVVKVAENPIINKIAFEGNKRINDESIKSEISLQPRSVYTRSQVQSDTKKIQDLYRKSGRFAATVDPKIVKLDQNRVNLVFEINEGKKTSVSKIYFIGNKRFDDAKLSTIINTKEYRWYTFYSNNDTYDTDKVSFDKELLRKFYMSKGYADFKVTSSTAEITKDKKSFILTFTVEEGPKYKFGDMKISSTLPSLQVDQLYNSVKTIKGDVFNANLVDDTIDKLTGRLNDLGYAFVEINTDYRRDTENLIIGVTYKISEGPKVYINRININGNVRTLDKVIRREFRIAEGDPFNAAKLRRSKQRLDNLGFFDKVDLENQRTDSPDKADINVSVTEKSTGELSFGAGISTNEGVLGNISLRERNLLGTGRDLRLSLQESSKVSQATLGFTEPYFMDKDIEAGFDLFNIEQDLQDESSFNSSTLGGTVHGSYSLTENLRHTVRYSAKTVDVNGVLSTASTFIKEQEGTTVTSLVGHTLMYDRRDNKFDPTEGYFIKFDEDFAGLGGDSQFFKNELSSGYYHPVFFDNVVFDLTGKIGHIQGWGGKNVNISDRFFIGGSTIRGFRNAGIGPRDLTTRDALGGDSYYAASAELTFPLGLPEELGFKGSTFIDAGSLFGVEDTGPTVVDSNSIRSAAGVGLSWSSPLGPIRIDIAYPIASESYDRIQHVRFNFGTRF